jgi:hypothetical protein
MANSLLSERMVLSLTYSSISNPVSPVATMQVDWWDRQDACHTDLSLSHHSGYSMSSIWSAI